MMTIFNSALTTILTRQSCCRIKPNYFMKRILQLMEYPIIKRMLFNGTHKKRDIKKAVSISWLHLQSAIALYTSFVTSSTTFNAINLQRYPIVRETKTFTQTIAVLLGCFLCLCNLRGTFPNDGFQMYLCSGFLFSFPKHGWSHDLIT